MKFLVALVAAAGIVAFTASANASPMCGSDTVADNPKPIVGS